MGLLLIESMNFFVRRLILNGDRLTDAIILL